MLNDRKKYGDVNIEQYTYVHEQRFSYVEHKDDEHYVKNTKVCMRTSSHRKIQQIQGDCKEIRRESEREVEKKNRSATIFGKMRNDAPSIQNMENGDEPKWKWSRDPSAPKI